KLQMDMETFSKNQGDRAGGLMQNLKEVNREKYDYTAFLKKFAVMGEAMKINDDEFDYIFYTYGLKLYKKVPLIEPLEYKEVKKIKEFVIAIDTSGSTSGDLVQTFLQKTYNILKSTESFFSRINLHIIQCDAEIQEDAKITTQEEFDSYLKHMKIRGLGGTDFRPVFQYVDQLQKAGEFTNLKGLIYFTDGWGTFPARKPDYDTAFVFIRDDYYNPEIPSWAIKLVLEKEDI
ncbi:MAG: VWA-like domain-containing protein, partial [Oscillospiraceae bacterium]|nr:VWA-like domain-containing protein [Oscillospiraceae bacterium]